MSVLGLLTFNVCVTWPWYNGWICLSRKTCCIVYHWKENLMLINICNRTCSWFLAVLRLLIFKEFVTWQWCKDECVFYAKPIVFGTVGKISSFKLFLSKRINSWLLKPRPLEERLLTSCFQNLQKNKITLSNTDNFTLQCFLFVDFKFLNLTADL